ncbi:hypothetical protein [Desulfosediminicola ganghwensis]|uniref:hypothetical protein n=1 Tax=Desulfosediminicola ganghwensis TaxID=2569540 RepID=UPI0010ACF51E|nr:hypothetical protein [Desulfosediminicola ganghwensis]
MTQWSVIDTKKYVEFQFGQEHLDLTAPSLHSLDQRLRYAQYHYQEIERIQAAFTETHLGTDPLLVVIYGGDETRRWGFEVMMIEVGAHATACILSIHAIADILAQAIYNVLGYSHAENERQALHERKINAYSVTRLLKQNRMYQKIAEKLADFCDDAQYKYVAALANRSKHHSIVRPQLSEDWTGKRTALHEFHFPAFRYNNKEFPELSFSEVLEPSYSLASHAVVEIGIMLNEILAKHHP